MKEASKEMVSEVTHVRMGWFEDKDEINYHIYYKTNRLRKKKTISLDGIIFVQIGVH